MSIIEQIKAEIERRLSYYHPENVNHGLASEFREDGKAIAYEELLSFLDALGEKSEKPTIPVDLEKEIKEYCGTRDICPVPDFIDAVARHFYELGCRRTAEKYDEIEYNRQRAEEPPVALVAIKPILPTALKPCIATFKEQSGSSEIPNDLEEAAKEYEKRVIEETKCHHNALTYAEGYENALLLIPDAFISGAKWQAGQMIEEAVPFYEILKAVPPGPERDKVRIIIVKED